jgi:hypothetical protein
MTLYQPQLKYAYIQWQSSIAYNIKIIVRKLFSNRIYEQPAEQVWVKERVALYCWIQSLSSSVESNCETRSVGKPYISLGKDN